MRPPEKLKLSGLSFTQTAINTSGIGEIWRGLKQDSPITSTFSRSLVNLRKAGAGDISNYKSES
jgi:hypothetical protein